MPTKPKPPAKPRAQAIAHMAEPTARPPGEWQLKTNFGFMETDGTPPKQLVRLADILTWLESSMSIPRDEALNRLCDAMPQEIMESLYFVKPGTRAKPVPLDHMFGYKTEAQIREDEIRSGRNDGRFSSVDGFGHLFRRQW